jgi:hypothetical protein
MILFGIQKSRHAIYGPRQPNTIAFTIARPNPPVPLFRKLVNDKPATRPGRVILPEVTSGFYGYAWTLKNTTYDP